MLKAPIAVLSGGETVTSGMTKVLEEVAEVIKFSGTIMTTLLDNPIYLFLFASSFVGVGIGIFSMLKSAAAGH